jgi:hypothetical protein
MSPEEFKKITDDYIAAVKEHQKAHAEFLADTRDEKRRDRYTAAVANVKSTGDQWRSAWKERY